MKKHSTRFIDFVKKIKPEIKETDSNAVKAKIDNDETFHLIDVREESEWGKGHLPQAIHLSKGTIERDIEKHIEDTDAEIILYCGGGYRSALAAFNLQTMGYTNVWSMDGGFRAWSNAEFSLIKDE